MRIGLPGELAQRRRIDQRARAARNDPQRALGRAVKAVAGVLEAIGKRCSTAVENVALWHERDISHSGAERVILPDATILLDYMQHLAIRVVRGMVVHLSLIHI